MLSDPFPSGMRFRKPTFLGPQTGMGLIETFARDRAQTRPTSCESDSDIGCAVGLIEGSPIETGMKFGVVVLTRC
jgi:hypothetical protein